MIVYLDTSSLLKLYVDEAGSDAVRQLVLRASVVTTSAVAYTEMRATFARLVREKRSRADEASARLREFEADWAATAVIGVDEHVLRSASELAARHSLRTLDAIHLASFVRVVERADDEDAHFSTFDDKLAKTAKRLG